MNKEYTNVKELLEDAKTALAHGSRRYADRILLFSKLTEELQAYVNREDLRLEARKEIRISIREFTQTVRDARAALDEWNLGAEITRRLHANLRSLVSSLDKLNKSIDS